MLYLGHSCVNTYCEPMRIWKACGSSLVVGPVVDGVRLLPLTLARSQNLEQNTLISYYILTSYAWMLQVLHYGQQFYLMANPGLFGDELTDVGGTDPVCSPLVHLDSGLAKLFQH